MEIKLRKIEPTDLPFLYQWENDAAAWADGSTHNPLSQQDLRDYISSSTGDIYRDGQLRLIVMTDGAIGGCVDLFDFDPRNRRAAIGMYIAPEMRGKRVGEQSLMALERYAFDFLHLRLIYAVIGEHNNACSALFKQSGYVPSSPLDDWTLEGAAVVWCKRIRQDGRTD